jgi:hypothetical protein
VELAELIARYRTKGVLVDTSLLVLLAVGIYLPGRITSFKRTKQYTIEDFYLVINLIHEFERRITTPHLLTEAHSFARQLEKREYDGLAAAFRKLIKEMFEIHVPATDVISEKSYPRLGLADSAIIKASPGVLVLTADAGLESELSRLGRHAININHLRTEYWT